MEQLPTTCPACHTPRVFDERICTACGLIFASVDALAPALPVAPPSVEVFPGPALPAPLPVGAALAGGRYRVCALLDGPHDVRYLAHDHALFGRVVVLLALPLAEDEASRESTLAYARALAQLHHPALPQTFACFQEGAALFVASEPGAGEPLAAHRPHQPDDVLRWGAQLYEALAYLHRRPPGQLRANLAPEAITYDPQGERLLLAQLAPADAAPDRAADVAALAATLYQLATGDDAHSGEFLRLGELGALGVALERALDPRAAARPSAGELATQLGALRQAGQRQPIDAPDGAALADVPQLVAWCEAHWPLAATWLAGQLPDLVALRWGDAQLASALRGLARQHANHHERLDAALALLDPQGFGSAPPAVAAPAQLRFGAQPANDSRTRLLVIANVGRRYLRCSLHTNFPGTVQLHPAVALLPGEQQSVTVGVTLVQGYTHLRTPLAIQHNGQTIANVEVRARLGRWSRNPKGMGCLSAILVLLFLCNAQSLANASDRLWHHTQFRIALAQGDTATIEQAFARLGYADRDAGGADAELRKEHYYQRGLAAFERNEYTTSQAAFLRLYELDPGYQDVALRLRTNYKREITRLIDYHLWGYAARALVALEAIPQSSSASYLSIPPEVQRALEPARAAAWHSGRMLREAPEQPQRERGDLSSNDGQLLIDLYSPEGVSVHRASDGSPVSTLESSAYWLGRSTIRFSPDGATIAVAANDGIHIARVADGAALGVLSNTLVAYEQGSSTFRNLTWSADGQLLAAISDSGVAIWGLRAKQRLWARDVEGKPNFATALAFSPDGRVLATTNGPSLLFWHAEDGALLRQISGGTAQLTSIAWSPGGERVAVGSGNDIRIWRVGNGALLATFERDGASSLAFSADGALLAAVGNTGVELWRIDGTRLLWSGPANSWGRVQFAPDGRSLVVVSSSVERWRPLP